MGEGGVEPSYFLEKMLFWEIRYFLKGMRKRNQSNWYTMRLHAFMILNAMGGKIEKPEDLFKLEWDDVAKDPVNEEEEAKKIAQMMREAEEWNRTH